MICRWIGQNGAIDPSHGDNWSRIGTEAAASQGEQEVANSGAIAGTDAEHRRIIFENHRVALLTTDRDRDWLWMHGARVWYLLGVKTMVQLTQKR